MINFTETSISGKIILFYFIMKLFLCIDALSTQYVIKCKIINCVIIVFIITIKLLFYLKILGIDSDFILSCFDAIALKP